MKRKFMMLASSMAMALGGCAGIEVVDESIKKESSRANAAFSAASVIANEARVTVHDRPFMPVEQVTERIKGGFLKKIDNLSISATAKTIPVSQVMAMLSARGINVVSDLPLNDYQYAGSIHSMDAHTMLKIVLSTTGLDFDVDDDRRLVHVKPMASKTWYFNVGRRSTTFSASGDGGSGGSGSGSRSSSSGGSGSSSGSVSASGSLSMESETGFWKSLEDELKARMSVMVPLGAKSAPAQASNAPSGAVASPPAQKKADTPVPYGNLSDAPVLDAPMNLGELSKLVDGGGLSMGAVSSLIGSSPNTGVTEYTSRTVGTYTMNQDTGAVTVQAPSWMLEELNAYFERIRDMNNAEITFTGQMVLVSDRDMNSAGLDISGFTNWVSKNYMGVVSNNALGGVTVSFPNGVGLPSVSAQNMPVSGPILGVRSMGLDGIALFNAYLAEQGGYSVVQKPIITTTSGVPAEFKKTTTRYYNTVSQNVASSTTSTAVGTQNELVPVDLGTILRVNPLLDMSTGLVRAQLSLSQVMSSGMQQIPQTITVGAGAQTYVTEIPILTKLAYSGEVLLKDGDLIIVGGQKEDSDTVSKNGLPGQKGGVQMAGGVLGTAKATQESSTYYFALVVRINKRQ